MIRFIDKLKNKRGFTLIELIVVLAVLAVIMAIAVPRFMGVQDKAKEDADKATLEMIAKAAELYYVRNSTDTDITILELENGDYIDTGLKFQKPVATVSDSTVKIVVDTGSGKVTVTKK
jgi:type IV pilus assembly protein PilA